MHVYIFIYIYNFLDLFSYMLLQNSECNSLHWTVGPSCLSVLYILVVYLLSQCLTLLQTRAL